MTDRKSQFVEFGMIRFVRWIAEHKSMSRDRNGVALPALPSVRAVRIGHRRMWAR